MTPDAGIWCQWCAAPFPCVLLNDFLTHLTAEHHLVVREARYEAGRILLVLEHETIELKGGNDLGD